MSWQSGEWWLHDDASDPPALADRWDGVGRRTRGRGVPGAGYAHRAPPTCPSEVTRHRVPVGRIEPARRDEGTPGSGPDDPAAEGDSAQPETRLEWLRERD